MAGARAIGRKIALAAGQRTLWFLYQLAPDTASYNAKAVFRVAPVELDLLARAVPGILAAAKTAGADVTQLSTRRLSLDDAFLRITGHSLREGT